MVGDETDFTVGEIEVRKRLGISWHISGFDCAKVLEKFLENFILGEAVDKIYSALPAAHGQFAADNIEIRVCV